MDLLPFSQINPCGYAGLEVTDMFCQGVEVPQDTIEQALLKHLQYRLTSAEIRAS
jgi:lipoyl(octanoyl) transferase